MRRHATAAGCRGFADSEQRPGPGPPAGPAAGPGEGRLNCTAPPSVPVQEG